MTGILFGTGIGPGDPELMTLKAVRLIRENDTIAVPGEKPEESIAYQIAVQAVPELAEKELVAIPMPMTKNAKELEENHRRGAEKIEVVIQLICSIFCSSPGHMHLLIWLSWHFL